MKKKYNSKWVDKLKKEFLIEQYIDLRKPMQEIANEVGCDKSTVNFYIMKENIEKRNNSESHKKENLRIETLKKMSESGKNRPSITEKTRKKLSESHLGARAYNFKYRVKDKDNYILIYSPNHPHKIQNKVRESRLVVEAQIRHYLDPKWVVHHINGIRDDNRIENLMCFINQSAHQRFHGNPNNVKDNEIIFDGRKLKEEHGTN